MTAFIGRREFITLLSDAAATTARPIAALAQQPTKVARIGSGPFGQDCASSAIRRVAISSPSSVGGMRGTKGCWPFNELVAATSI
jgi:hypothetical protein